MAGVIDDDAGPVGPGTESGEDVGAGGVTGERQTRVRHGTNAGRAGDGGIGLAVCGHTVSLHSLGMHFIIDREAGSLRDFPDRVSPTPDGPVAVWMGSAVVPRGASNGGRGAGVGGGRGMCTEMHGTRASGGDRGGDRQWLLGILVCSTDQRGALEVTEDQGCAGTVHGWSIDWCYARSLLPIIADYSRECKRGFGEDADCLGGREAGGSRGHVGSSGAVRVCRGCRARRPR